MMSIQAREEVGRKVKLLRGNFGISQANLGIKAFGMTESGGQSHVRKIELGLLKTVTKNDIEKILSVFNISMDEFNSLEAPPEEAPKGKTPDIVVNGEVLPKEFLKIWPEAPKYFRMLQDAQDAGDTELEKIITERMALSLREQAAAYSELVKKEKEQGKKKEA